ncbi:conserved hypothetical protein [Xenorhabdus nematophila ATCC 19061]|uniref:Uncharacterized protein n=1 Tax=Xenorhabdus nematophila (strain ATCC 19061 / DSM 3370 / CCUG 14189 / LMG 1036 / NCIMB 9965 / AN6) TaxID=406817 RepID=D3VDK3_XENNA|nr:hypothetical protein [Xenorhabdus nematophila]CBJ92243.1 conserved hypothetical protein [Xenorhabdus nematophila ATCC 19061]CEK25058.1 conserved hypothetical protein [Xenorhabdus nematophila AN6/1]
MATDTLMLSNLFNIGAERLALLGKHHRALMQCYLDGFIDETALSENALKKLIDARILWRPDEHMPLTLRALISELIASMVADENRRQINADVAEKLEQIRNKVQAWRDAYYKGDYSVAELQLQRLTEHVYDLSGQFEEAIDSLWNRLNSDFGFVRSLNEKINENERAQKQVRRLLDGLELLDFNEFIELSEGNNHLRKLLVSQLQIRLSLQHSSLLEVQRRLVALLAKFRQQQSRSLLITNMVAFLRQHPQYKPANYTYRSDIPPLFNQSAPLHLQGALALDRSGERQVLAELIRTLPVSAKIPLSDFQSASSVITFVDEEVAARQQALKQDVENFYMYVIDSMKEISALDYLIDQELTWDNEIWLYQVIAEYQSLEQKVKSRFWLRNDEIKASPVNDLKLILDITVRIIEK